MWGWEMDELDRFVATVGRASKGKGEEWDLFLFIKPSCGCVQSIWLFVLDMTESKKPKKRIVESIEEARTGRRAHTFFDRGVQPDPSRHGPGLDTPQKAVAAQRASTKGWMWIECMSTNASWSAAMAVGLLIAPNRAWDRKEAAEAE